VQEDEEAEAERERHEFASVREEAVQALQQKDEVIGLNDGDSVGEEQERSKRRERVIVWDSTSHTPSIFLS